MKVVCYGHTPDLTVRMMPSTNDQGFPEFLLVNPVDYDLDIDGCSGIVRVPSGFIFDFGSVPRWLYSIQSPVDAECNRAYLLHDWLYATEMFPRHIADELLRETAKLGGAGLWERNKIYYAVRLGGGKPWREHTQESIENNRYLMHGHKLNPWGPYLNFRPVMRL